MNPMSRENADLVRPSRIVHVSASEAARAPSWMDGILAGDPDVVVLKGVFTADEVAAVARTLEAHPAWRRALSVESTVEFIGLPLQWVDQDLDTYLTAADEARSAAAELLEGTLLPRLQALLAQVCGRPVREIETAEGRRFASATLRRLPPGSAVGPHFELGQLDFPGYRGLRPQIDETTLLSFYLLVQPSERGGELALHDLRWGHPDAPRVQSTMLDDDTLFGLHPPRVVPMSAGDVVVFDSGHIAHRVLEVRGSRPRWTMGGLLSPSPDGTLVRCWA